MATIHGSNGDEWRWGSDGNDVILLYGGDDTCAGRDGDDFIFGHDGHDFLHGDAGNDVLDGGAGYDVLKGDGGNDTLVGGMDNDVMYGGVGADKFVTTSIVDMWGVGDRISDFHWWEGDKIDLRGIDAKAHSSWDSSTWGDQAFSWVGHTGSAPIALGKGQLGYYKDADFGYSYVYGNVDGDPTFEFFIWVSLDVSFIRSDFQL